MIGPIINHLLENRRRVEEEEEEQQQFHGGKPMFYRIGNHYYNLAWLKEIWPPAPFTQIESEKTKWRLWFGKPSGAISVDKAVVDDILERLEVRK